MRNSGLNQGGFVLKSFLFIILTFGLSVGTARAEYWIDSPPIQAGCGFYVYGYGMTSCSERKYYKPYKHRVVKKYHRQYKPVKRNHYKVDVFYYIPAAQPTCSSCCGCSAMRACNGCYERYRSDGSYYSEPIMGGYPSYSYVNQTYSGDMTTGDDNPMVYADVNYYSY